MRGSVCLLGHVFNSISQAVENSAFAFTSCLGKASRSAGVECIGPSHVFLERAHSPACTRLYTCAWTSRLLRICQSCSEPLWTSNLPAFPLSFLTSLSVAANNPMPQRARKLKHFVKSFAKSSVRRRLFLHWVDSKLGQMQIALQASDVFQKTSRWVR